MFAIYMIGLGLIGVISGAFSYELIIPEIVILASISYVVYYFIIGKPKVLRWTLFLLFVILTGTSVYLQRQELLMGTISSIYEFLKPYYYSVSVEALYIGKVHQQLMIGTLGLVVFWFVFLCYKTERFKKLPPIFGMILIISSYFAGVFSSGKDRSAFILFIISVFVYYFEIYYIQLQDSEGVKRRVSFYTLSLIMVGIILVGAVGVNSTYQNPFQKRVKKTPGVIATNIDDENLLDYEILEVVYAVNDFHEVQKSFEHQGIMVFKVETDKLKYFKSQTFDRFVGGVWENTLNEPVSTSADTGWPVEPALKDEIYLNEDIFYNSEVKVVYNNYFTDSLITAPYTRSVLLDVVTTHVTIYEDGMFVADNMVGKNFTYHMSVSIPKYRTTALTEYLESSEDDGYDLTPYIAVPRGYDEIYALSDEITTDLTTDIEKAEAIEHYFKSEFTYDENPGFVSNDFISEFVLEKKAGFCQQFATSMVLMLRAQGIPSRFVTGYVVGPDQFELDDVPIENIYRNQELAPFKFVYDYNAHTWVEIYVPNFGWVQYEPTPGQSVLQFSDPIDYDALNEQADANKQGINIINHETVGISLGFLVLIGLIIFVVLFVRRGKRLNKDVLRRLKVNYKLLLIYTKAAMMGKENNESIREYSLRIHPGFKYMSHSLKEFVVMFEKAFYNDEVPEFVEVEVLEEFIEEIKELARKSTTSIVYRRLKLHELVIKHR